MPSNNSLLKEEHTFEVCSPLTFNVGPFYPVKVTEWIDDLHVRGYIDESKLTTVQRIALL